MDTPLRLGRVSEDTIRNALLYIRAEIVRDGLDGLEHVDALLAMRGHDPVHVPRKTNRRFKRGKLRLAILDALRSGVLTGREIAEAVRVGAPSLTYGQAYKRTYIALHAMKEGGIVEREKDRLGRYVWRLASDAPQRS